MGCHGRDDVIALRALRPDDVDTARALVARTMLATYGPFSPRVRAVVAEQGMAALVAADLAFSGAWVAVDAGGAGGEAGPERIRGLVWTQADLLRELFVEPAGQGRGIGSLLLHVAEREIAARGHAEARLNVAAPNARARRFYAAHGWRDSAAAAPARWDFAMIEMTKALRPADRPGRG